MDSLMPGGRHGTGLRRHWRLSSGALLLVVAAVTAIQLSGFHGRRLAAIVVPYPHELAQVSFAVAGDVIPHEAVRAAAGAAATAGAPPTRPGWGGVFFDV